MTMPDCGPALAYVYNGDWVADCPAGCNNVEFLFDQLRMNGPRVNRKPFYRCSNCAYATERVIFPRRELEIMEALNKRPNPSTRNWYPQDHPIAVRFNVPHGQSVADLLAENEDHGVR